MHFLFLATLWITASFTALAAAPKELTWQSDYKTALKLAEEQKKPLILFFTGSDWCSYCNMMEQEVLSRPEFIEAVSQNFVFLKLDFPMRKQQSADLTTQNKALLEKYNIEGFPTLVVLDSHGQIIGTVGYKPGGPQNTVNFLKSMVDAHQQEKSETQKTSR